MFARRTDWNLAENVYARALRAHVEQGRPLLDLTASNPTACGFAYEEQRILAALATPAVLRYEPAAKGLPEARRAIARYYGGIVDPERILLATSTSEAYTWVFRLLCEPGDEVVTVSPSYPLFEFLADIQDVRLVSCPLFYDHGWHLDLHAIERRIGPRTRAVVLVHPNNPTGHYTKPGERDALNRLCTERGLALVVDEVFLDYALDGAPQSFAGDDGALTFVLSGLSKVAALPQMKAAWIVVGGPDGLVAPAVARLEVIADTYLSLSAPIQHAVPALLDTRTAIQRQLMTRIRRNLRALDAELARRSLSTRLVVEGGWYAVLRVPAFGSDEDLAVSLLREQDVLVHPGHFYGFERDGFLVASLIADEATFAEGARRMLRHVEASPERRFPSRGDTEGEEANHGSHG